MKISVLTPTLNRPGMLARAAASMVAQTHTDWEWVVYDVSDQPVKSVLPSDRRIRYSRGRPGGPAADFQHALGVATGDLVIPLSDDDTLTADALEVIAANIGDADWLVAGTVIETEDGRVLAHRGGNLESVAMTVNGDYMLGGAVCWRRTLTDALGGFDPGFDGAADFDLYTRFARYAAPVVVANVIYRYLEHPATDSNVRRDNQREQTQRIRAALA